MKAALVHWFVQVFIALDQFINALFGGWADETLSSHAWRMWVKKLIAGRIFRPVYDALFIWQTWRMDHCERAYNKELRRYNSPLEMRAPEDRNL
jgi:hypothetical protein